MANEVKLSPQSLLNTKEIDAVSEVMKHGLLARIVSRDGQALPLTEDYIPNRWDLEVERGVVVGVRLPQNV